MDCVKYIENLLNIIRDRQEVYALQILSGTKSHDEYKNFCGKFQALRECEEFVRKVYKEMFEIKSKEEEREYGELQ